VSEKRVAWAALTFYCVKIYAYFSAQNAYDPESTFQGLPWIKFTD
jgi:hypothetical protein